MIGRGDRILSILAALTWRVMAVSLTRKVEGSPCLARLLALVFGTQCDQLRQLRTASSVTDWLRCVVLLLVM